MLNTGERSLEVIERLGSVLQPRWQPDSRDDRPLQHSAQDLERQSVAIADGLPSTPLRSIEQHSSDVATGVIRPRYRDVDTKVGQADVRAYDVSAVAERLRHVVA